MFVPRKNETVCDFSTEVALGDPGDIRSVGGIVGVTIVDSIGFRFQGFETTPFVLSPTPSLESLNAQLHHSSELCRSQPDAESRNLGNRGA